MELPSSVMTELAPYFDRELLDCTRIVYTEPLPIPGLPFTSMLKRCRLHVPTPDEIAAITFDNVVAARKLPSSRLLFHELVHVVQYRTLGIGGFARRYVEGFLSEGCYERIPLECCAWSLEERFVQDPTPFRVEAAVKSWMDEPQL